jgi:DNA-binding transcriptional LysR family regulator
MVDLEWYRSFLAIYRAGTVSGAARTLFLTQPAVTQHLASLEKAVGELLFTRTARSMLPTPRGKELYTQIVQSLERLEQVSQSLQQGQSELPLVRCGAPLEYFSEVALEALVHAPYRLWFQFGETRVLLDLLEQGELDVLIATQRISSHDVEYSKLGEESFYLVGPTSLVVPEVSSNESIDEELEQIESWLASQTWISYGVELPIIRRFWQHCFAKRPEFQAAMVIPNLHTLAKAVELGSGISILPDYLCKARIEAGGLHILWQPPDPVKNELWLTFRKIDRNNQMIKRFKTLLS